MLGPVDLDGWRDDDKDEELRARLSACSEIQLLRGKSKVTRLPGWGADDLALARRFAAGEALDAAEVRLLASRLGA